MESSTNAAYVDTSILPAKIQGWIDAMEKYRLGIYVDADVALTD